MPVVSCYDFPLFFLSLLSPLFISLPLARPVPVAWRIVSKATLNVLFFSLIRSPLGPQGSDCCSVLAILTLWPKLSKSKATKPDKDSAFEVPKLWHSFTFSFKQRRGTWFGANTSDYTLSPPVSVWAIKTLLGNGDRHHLSDWICLIFCQLLINCPMWMYPLAKNGIKLSIFLGDSHFLVWLPW